MSPSTPSTAISTIISSLPPPFNTLSPLPDDIIAYIPLIRTVGSLFIPYDSTTDYNETKNAIVLKVGSSITNIHPGDTVVPIPSQGVLLTEANDIRLLRYRLSDLIAVITD